MQPCLENCHISYTQGKMLAQERFCQIFLEGTKETITCKKCISLAVEGKSLSRVSRQRGRDIEYVVMSTWSGNLASVQVSILSWNEK